ncbi:MAG TPA: type II secretion system protein [Pirellulaceae bacterium]|nr:type II secretion system protein [Pirellulaceae bacterium]
MARLARSARRGFTLVEMLVVLAIIGLIAALLVPAIAVAMRSARQGATRIEMDQIAQAIESYKTKFNNYPIDCFGEYGLDPTFRLNLINTHIKSINRNADTSLLPQWLIADLPNPHFGQVAGSPATRNPRSMMPHEAIVFLLTELSTNASSPLGYRYDGSNWLLVDYNLVSGQYVLVGGKHSFFEPRPGQLRDFDGDGWLEYVPAGIDVPYVYYDSRIARLPTTTSLAMDFNTGLAAPGLPYTATGVSGAGFPQPYWKVSPTPATALPIHDHYQLLSCGVDSNYGRNLTTRGLRIFPPTIQSLESAERDNLANFTESRLDAALQQ